LTATLKNLVQAEIARRADANAGRYAPERVVIDDGDPDREAKIAAVQAKYPGKIVVVHRIFDSRMRHVARPEVTEGVGPSSPAARIDDNDDDTAQRAAERAAERVTTPLWSVSSTLAKELLKP
jgi:hypothetical protein